MRAVVNVATGQYVRGQERLIEECARQGVEYVHWRDRLPVGSPTHEEVPYAFKAVALQQAADEGFTTLLWADASILPIRSLEPLFERIELDGYWIGNNGYTNYEWTADSAYPALFTHYELGAARHLNNTVPHVVATAFGVDLTKPAGRNILAEYHRLATQTRAFCGPWKNGPRTPDGRSGPCGPQDVRGHRHDQTALSVIAWRLGCRLTNSPEVFAYRGGEREYTILVADGAING